MRIINQEEFYEMPAGTLFAEYESLNFDGLYIKCQTIYDKDDTAKDYVFISLLDNPLCDNDTEYADVLFTSEYNSTSFDLDFNCGERYGLQKENQLYAIYEERDVNGFISKLKELKQYNFEKS